MNTKDKNKGLKGIELSVCIGNVNIDGLKLIRSLRIYFPWDDFNLLFKVLSKSKEKIPPFLLLKYL